MQQNLTPADATAALKRRLDTWRKSNRPRAPMPYELWLEAAELATQQGIYRTSKALGLSYTSLKQRVVANTSGAGPVASCARSPEMAFVELLPPIEECMTECELEVEPLRGPRLRIRMKNLAPSGLATIIRQIAVS